MGRLIRSRPWIVTVNYRFQEVIEACAEIIRPDQTGTWISDEMKEAYIDLHRHGNAHSIEVWDNDVMIGGLYGVLIGKIFYGESMFSHQSNASKYGFLSLAKWLFQNGCTLIDCQQDTDHMRSLGTTLVDKKAFWELIKENQLEGDIDLASVKYLVRSDKEAS